MKYPFAAISGIFTQGGLVEKHSHFVLADDSTDALHQVRSSLKDGRTMLVPPVPFDTLMWTNTGAIGALRRVFNKHGYSAGSVKALELVQLNCRVRIDMPDGRHGWGKVVGLGRDDENNLTCVCHLHTIDLPNDLRRHPQPEEVQQHRKASEVTVLYS